MSKKEVKNKCAYLEDCDSLTCHNIHLKNNRTVYVDAKYGTRHGKINSPKCPFNTITRAIKAIKSILKTTETQWLIRVDPGVYHERVTVPVFVNILGAGTGVVTVTAMTVTGTSTISNLSIISTDLPILSTSLENSDPVENSIVFDNIVVSASEIPATNNLPVISITGVGMNSHVKIINSEITATVSATNPARSDQILCDLHSSTAFSNTNVNFIADWKSAAIFFQINETVTVNGGNFAFAVSDGPADEVTLFRLESGQIYLVGNASAINVLILHKSYKADVSYIKSFGGSFARVSNSTAYLDGIARDFLNLVYNLGAGAEINILGLTTPLIPVPRLKGIRNRIKYAAISGRGDIVASGGLYANIITVTSAHHPRGYFLAENDFTVLSDGANIHIFDPAFADEVVTDKGKIIIIRNIGATPITVNSQRNSIFDGPQTVPPSASIMLQNDAVMWYKISNT